MKHLHELSRRAFLRAGALATASVPFLSSDVRAAPADGVPDPDPWRGLKISVATYTFRSIPLDDTIKGIQRVGLHYCSIKDSHLSLKSTPEERKAVVARFKAAGITPLSAGNISMENNEDQIRSIFEYARDAGLQDIVCTPHPDSMPILDKMVKEFDIRIAIHNHGPGDKRFPSPYDAMSAVEKYDKRLGLCIDVGHTVRAGVDPAEAIHKCRARLYDLHFKDLNSTKPNGSPIEVGRGAMDKRAILQALLDIRYPYLVSFEYEKDGADPLPGLAESVGYTRGVLSDMKA